MLKIIIMLLLLTVTTTVCAKTLQDATVEQSAKYLNVRERTNSNDSPEIDAMLQYLGLPKGLSWCAAYMLTCYRDGAEAIGIKQPIPKIGRVSLLWQTCKARELSFKTFSAEDVNMGIQKLQPADIPCWRHGSTATQNFNGHTGIVLTQIDKKTFTAREGNTVAGSAGGQREQAKGDKNQGGVFDRTRTLGLGSSFAVVGFIRVR